MCIWIFGYLLKFRFRYDILSTKIICLNTKNIGYLYLSKYSYGIGIILLVFVCTICFTPEKMGGLSSYSLQTVEKQVQVTWTVCNIFIIGSIPRPPAMEEEFDTSSMVAILIQCDYMTRHSHFPLQLVGCILHASTLTGLLFVVHGMFRNCLKF